MTTNRKPRAEETRASEERITEWKPPSQRVAISNTEDWIFRWVRYKEGDSDAVANMQKRLQEGYEIVSPSDPDVRDEVAKGHLMVSEGKIVQKDTVLMKFSRELANQRNRYYTEQANLHQQTVSQALQEHRHKSMPLTEKIDRS